jgi:hypothetical protein
MKVGRGGHGEAALLSLVQLAAAADLLAGVSVQ